MEIKLGHHPTVWTLELMNVVVSNLQGIHLQNGSLMFLGRKTSTYFSVDLFILLLPLATYYRIGLSVNWFNVHIFIHLRDSKARSCRYC